VGYCITVFTSSEGDLLLVSHGLYRLECAGFGENLTQYWPGDPRVFVSFQVINSNKGTIEESEPWSEYRIIPLTIAVESLFVVGSSSLAALGMRKGRRKSLLDTRCNGAARSRHNRSSSDGVCGDNHPVQGTFPWQ